MPTFLAPLFQFFAECAKAFNSVFSSKNTSAMVQAAEVKNEQEKDDEFKALLAKAQAGDPAAQAEVRKRLGK